MAFSELWVDAVEGSNETGNGTITQPYQTLESTIGLIEGTGNDKQATTIRLFTSPGFNPASAVLGDQIHRVSTTLEVPANCTIEAAVGSDAQRQRGMAVIAPDASFPNGQALIRLHRFSRLIGVGVYNPTGWGVDMSGFYCALSHSSLWGCGGDAVRVTTSADGPRILYCLIMNNAGYGVRTVDPATGASVNDLLIMGCRISGAGGAGPNALGGIRIDASWDQSGATPGSNAWYPAMPNKILVAHNQLHGQNVLEIKGGHGVQVWGNYFETTFPITAPVVSIRRGGQIVFQGTVTDTDVGWWATNVDFKANHFNAGGDIGGFSGTGRVIDIDQALAVTIDHHNEWRRSGTESNPLVFFGANTRGCRYHFPPVYRTNNRGNIESVVARIVGDANSASNFGFWYNPNLNRYVTLGTQPGP